MYNCILFDTIPACVVGNPGKIKHRNENRSRSNKGSIINSYLDQSIQLYIISKNNRFFVLMQMNKLCSF